MASSPRKLGCKLRQGVHHADKHVVRYASSHGSYQSRFTLLNDTRDGRARSSEFCRKFR